MLILSLVILALILFFLFAPRSKVTLFWTPERTRFSELQIDQPPKTSDLKLIKDKLAEQEGAVIGLTPNTEKYIQFSSESRPKQTAYSLLYLHGYSATRHELSPVPENVAKTLHMNYHATRLTGHGLDGEALANAKASDWIYDLQEAWQVASALGEKVIVMATSTGGTLATWLAQQPQAQTKLAGIVLFSPNFRTQHWASPMFLWPLAKYWMKFISPKEYGWEPENDAAAKYWTHSYPVRGLHEMIALVKAVRQSALAQISAPTLLINSEADKVVNSATTDAVFRRWGAAVRHHILLQGRANDNNHVISGDIVRPDTTERCSTEVIHFLRTQVIRPIK